MSLQTLQNELKDAQARLSELQAELPQFRALLSDNEQEAEQLKRERASLDQQAKAQGRVRVAREMLEQHHHDLASANAEVLRLEAARSRAALLVRMAAHARVATKQRDKLDKAVADGGAALGKAFKEIDAAFSAITHEREAFALLGRELEPEFHGHSPYGGDMVSQKRKDVAQHMLSEIEADLTDVLDRSTGSHSRMDSETRPLPKDEYALLLWAAFNEAVAKQQAKYRIISLPRKRY